MESHTDNQTNTTRTIFQQAPNVGTMLAHRLRRWPNIVPTLGKRLVFAGIYLPGGGK